MTHRATEYIRLLDEKPMGMRVKSGPWLRGALYEMCQEVIRLSDTVEKAEAFVAAVLPLENAE